MKIILIAMLALFSLSGFARLYVAGSISSVKQVDTSEDGDLNEGVLLAGNGFSTYVGYRFSFLALEGFYKTISAQVDDSTFEFDYEDKIVGLGIRVYIMKYLNVKFGNMTHNASGDFILKATNTVAFKYASQSTNSYIGAGIRIPFGGVDLFGDYTVHATKDDNESDSGIAFSDIEFGLRYYF